MSALSPRIVVVGSVNADLVVRVARRPAPGETVMGDSIEILPGGKGANQALAAAVVASRYDEDLPVAMVGAVGDDPNSTIALRELAGAGVDVSAVCRLPGVSTGVASITVGRDGDNSIVVVPGANGLVDASFVRRHAHLISGAQVVVAQMEVPMDAVETAARLASGRFILNLAPVRPAPAWLFRRADPLVVNEHEAAAALSILGREQRDGSSVAGRPGQIAEADPEARCAISLVEMGVPSVVVTLGARGCLVARDGDQPVRIPALTVPVVDTTGAGDAFVGALAARLAQGDSLTDACVLATRVSAYSVQHEGTQPSYPRPGDVLPVPLSPWRPIPPS